MAACMLGPSYSSMRAQNRFTDAVVESEGGSEWRVHKVILSRLGSFFFNTFSVPSFSGTLDLGASDDVVQCIVDFAYEGVCNVNVENALDTLAVALTYQLESLIEGCINFILENMMSPEHVFTVKAFATIHRDALEVCTDGALTDALNKWMKKNFSIICDNEQIYEISYEELEAIVGEDDLNIQEEDLEFLLKFIKEKKLNREEATQLLANVRQVLIDPLKLSQILQENQTLTFEIEKSRETYDTHRPRFPTEIVISIGGSDLWHLPLGEVFDFRKNEWNPIEKNKLSSKFFKEGVRYVIDGNIIYSFEFREEGLIIVKSIDITDGHSVLAEYVKFPTEYGNVDNYSEIIAWNGGILVVTAVDYDMKTEIVRFYNPSEKSWSSLPTSQELGWSSTLVVVNGNLFGIGGFTGDDEDRSWNIAYYDVQTKEWSVCGLLKSVSGWNQAAVVEDTVYIFPDFSDGDEVEGECFQPVFENGRMRLDWFPTIKTPWKEREYNNMLAIGNKIMFTGGDKDGIETKECQVYSPTNGEWSVAADLSVEDYRDVITVNLDGLKMETIEELCSGKILKGG